MAHPEPFDLRLVSRLYVLANRFSSRNEVEKDQPFDPGEIRSYSYVGTRWILDASGRPVKRSLVYFFTQYRVFFFVLIEECYIIN